MKKILDKIVEKRAAAELKATQEKQADEQEFIEAAVTRFKLGLGSSGLDWLFEYGKTSINWIDKDSHLIEVIWQIDSEKCRALEVSKCKIIAKFHETRENFYQKTQPLDGNEPVIYLYGCRKNCRYEDEWLVYATFEDMVASARKCYPTWAKEELAAKVAEAVKESKGQDALNPNRNRDETEARALHKKLCEIAPDRTAEWDKRLESWLEDETEIQARKAAEEKREAELQAALDSYRAEYATWWKEAQTIHEKNKRVAAEVQKAYDTPVQLYELEYGIVAQDFNDPEEGIEGGVTRYVETRKVMMRTPGDKQGNFLNLRHEPMHWWNPINTLPVMAIASEHPSGAWEWHGIPSPFDGDDYDISVNYIIGAASDSEIEQALKDAGWQEYPTRPERPQHVNYRALNEIESRVENGTEPEPEASDDDNQDLPF